MAAAVRPAPDTALTAREVEILRLAAAGRTNEQIGRELSITGSTVKSHLRRVMARLGARDRAHAVALGYQRGLLPGPQGLSRAVLENVLAAQRERLARGLEAVAREQYPPEVFAPGGVAPDAVAGCAMRHAYLAAARMVRDGRLPAGAAGGAEASS